MIDYEKLLEFLVENMKSEERLFESAKTININSCGACMSLGGFDAYKRVLDFITGKLDD
jgi:hypothetical protein